MTVLDVCCGSRMFWFDRKDERAVFVDKRKERNTLPDKSSKGWSRELIVDPDIQADFTALPFADNSFSLLCSTRRICKRQGRKAGWRKNTVSSKAIGVTNFSGALPNVSGY